MTHVFRSILRGWEGMESAFRDAQGAAYSKRFKLVAPLDWRHQSLE